MKWIAAIFVGAVLAVGVMGVIATGSLRLPETIDVGWAIIAGAFILRLGRD